MTLGRTVGIGPANNMVTMGRLMLLLSILTLIGPRLNAQAPSTVFKGRPVVKISEGGTERTPSPVPPDSAVNLECVISQIGNSYYWASRENTPMTRIDAGAFTTYLATNGAGYVRVINAEAKNAAALMGDAEAKFDYVEHALIGLRSVTYYGLRR